MKQIQIDEFMCKPPQWHGKWGHFAVGEKKCRKCEVFWKPEYKADNCPICHNHLSTHRRYVTAHKYVIQ